MRVHLFSVCLLLFSLSTARSQSPDSTVPTGLVFLPGRLFFIPLTASYQEPRVGVRKEIGSSKLKLDIGSSLDLLGYNSETMHVRLGIDFFTHALTTSADGLRLQVDAVDGYFGGHLALGSTTNGSAVRIRLRLLHVSGHLIDGHWDPSAKKWKDDKQPIPYTRDFGELSGLYEWSGRNFALAAYSGFSYSTLVRPDSLARWGTLHGVEIRTTGLVGPVFGRPCVFYVAEHLSVAGIPAYSLTHTLESGVKFGPWEGAGIKLYLNYFNGLDPFSQYFFLHRENWGLGLSFDFW